MESLQPVPQWIGPHRRVVPDRYFEIDDPEERPIEGLRCLDCHRFEETRHELGQIPCQPT